MNLPAQANVLRDSVAGFVRYLSLRFRQDQCARAASALAYTSLLALVPLFTVLMVFFSMFPAFDSLRENLEAFTFENFVPGFGGTVREYLTEFADKARGLTTAGIGVLIFTVLAMMSTIEETFNVIWRIERRRPFWLRFLVYWAVLTLGPLLIGVGLAATSYVASLPLIAQTGSVKLLGLLPLVTTTLAFMIVFKAVPNRRVPLRHAVMGAVAASLLFELAKRAFTWYVVNVPGQEAIYGAFATLPVFLVWIYLSWTIVLFGAEVTQCLTTYRVLGRRHVQGMPGNDLYTAFRILLRLHEAQHDGHGVTESEMVSREPDLAFIDVARITDLLGKAGWISRTENYRWMLARDMHESTLYDLVAVVPSSTMRSHMPLLHADPADPADARLGEVLAQMEHHRSELFGMPLSQLMHGN
ncbi:MAG: YihY family inner membrane protein [Gammaproteobacteria bacterium]|nr:YihY family inner membrane protein [Gammaproteobacteria bacterium]